MSTLVVSDLHLGSRTGVDVLRAGTIRAALVEALEGVERLVLLGDVLELRHGPRREALEVARPVLRELGDALGGGEVVLVPGNHDHHLLARWMEERGRDGPAPRLTLEQRLAPAEASQAAESVAEWMAPATVSVAYPGAWLRDDVYAMHGHYLDCHGTVPTFERLAAGAMNRLVGPLPAAPRRPEDYEARLAPIYAFLDTLAQHAGPGRPAGGAGSAGRRWRLLAGDGHRPVKARLLAGTVPVGVALLNRTGVGPLRSDLSGAELRRAGLRAMGEVVSGLSLEAEHVIFGHTHRAGPLSDDDGAEWIAPTGSRLLNCGSWVHERSLTATAHAASPYWPGGCVEVGADGPPVLRRLLDEHSVDDLGVA